MKLLIIGGAGYVGTIIREAMETRFTCTHLDLRPVAGTTSRMLLGDVNDDATLAEAVAGQEALLYLAMGSLNNEPRSVNQIDPAFSVNVRGLYRTLSHALAAGVRRFVYTSTLSVYHPIHRPVPVDEQTPPDAWHPYGLSKRLGELVCSAAAQQAPDASVLALRLNHPRNEADWAALLKKPDQQQKMLAIGPQDVRRLFCAALAFHRPGFHVVQASSDTAGERLPPHRAAELLGWSPRLE